MELYIRTKENRIIPVEVKEDATVRALKLKLKKQEGFPMPVQYICLNSTSLEDSWKLSQYGIGPKTILDISLIVEINLKFRDNSIKIVRIEKHSTISELRKAVYEQCNTDLSGKSIYFNGHELEDDLTIYDYGMVENYSTFTVSSKSKSFEETEETMEFEEIMESKANKMTVYVKTLTGKTLTVKVGCNDLVEYIARAIQDKEGHPADQMRLIFKGKQLEFNRTVAEYNIRKGDTVHLVLKLRAC